MVRPPAQLGVDAETLAAAYPTLYHLAAADSWPSIMKHGLHSTKSLLDLFEVDGARRRALLSQHRANWETIKHARKGTAALRDQKPMSEKRLAAILQDGLTTSEWFELLNEFVFFWPTKKRLETMLSAYQGQRQTLITIDAASMLQDYQARLRLSAINSGATRPMARPRGRRTFLPLPEYPFDQRYAANKAGAVAEIVVEGSVKNIVKYVTAVFEVDNAGKTKRLWAPT